MKIEIGARKREVKGTGASRRLRRAGKVPGVLYGGSQGPVSLEFDHQSLYLKLRDEKFHASILTLDLDGSKEQVLLRSFNMHPVKREVQHVDFERVSKDRKVHMKVPLHFVNAENSPGVKVQAGVASHVLNELEIRCFPDDLPEYIEVDMGQMSIGDSIHARDLALPKGVEAVLHREENPVVATIVMPALVVEEEAPAEAAVAAGEVPAAEQAAAAPAGEAAPAAGAAKAAPAAAAPAAKPEKKEKK